MVHVLLSYFPRLTHDTNVEKVTNLTRLLTELDQLGYCSLTSTSVCMMCLVFASMSTDAYQIQPGCVPLTKCFSSLSLNIKLTFLDSILRLHMCTKITLQDLNLPYFFKVN